MLFRYVMRSLHIALAGKTLAGWTDPRQKVFPPKVDAFLNPLNTEAYECFALALFRRTGLPELHDSARLLQFRNQMIATFLMRMEDMEDALGEKDMILTHVVKCAGEVGITKAKLLVWGKLIKRKFDAENSAQRVDSSVAPGVVRSLQELTAILLKQREEDRASVAVSDQKVSELTSEVQL